MVTAAEVLSIATFVDGRHAQAFPSFGSERTGEPVVAFCRIDDRLRGREPISEADALIIPGTPTLLRQVDVFSGLGRDGFILINSTRSPIEPPATKLTSPHRSSVVARRVDIGGSPRCRRGPTGGCSGN